MTLINTDALVSHLAGKVAIPTAILPVAQVAIEEAQAGHWTELLDFPAGYSRTVEETIDKFGLHEFVAGL